MTLFKKKQFIASLKEGDIVDDVFFVKFKKGLNPYKNGHSIGLTLSDNSGNIEYKLWGDNDLEKIKAVYETIHPDSVVKIVGKTSTFRNQLQLSSNQLTNITVLNKGDYDISDFIKPPKRNIDKMFSELTNAIELVEDSSIKSLLNGLFTDELIKASFKEQPGGIEIHHNWVSGLLQHTLEVLNHCLLCAEQFPELNKDLLIAGALLHDIGKLEELTMTTRIKGTVKGQLLGHITIGSIQIANKCDELSLPEDLKNKLLHMMVSHHGCLEYGSPKAPMFPEALAVYYADEISSKLAEMIGFINNAKQRTEDDFMYYRRAGRNILLD